MTKKTTPSTPKGLSADSVILWREILADWRIADAASLKVLETGLRALDRAEACRTRIDAEGEALRDRFGQLKPHPLLPAERDARSQFLTALKQLGLEYE